MTNQQGWMVVVVLVFVCLTFWVLSIVYNHYGIIETYLDRGCTKQPVIGMSTLEWVCPPQPQLETGNDD